MSENDAFENTLRRVIVPPRPIDTNEEKESKNKETDLTEKTALSQGDPIGKAKEDVGLAWWEGIRRIIPLVVSLVWVVVALAVIVIVSSLLAVWVIYIRHLLTDIEGIKSFLSGVYSFLGGVASTSLLFYLNRKPPR